MSYGRSALAEEATIGFENDAWAVGATIFEVVTGIALFQTEDQVLSLVRNHELLEKEIDEKLGELLFQHGLSRAPEAQGVDAFAMHASWNECYQPAAPLDICARSYHPVLGSCARRGV